VLRQRIVSAVLIAPPVVAAIILGSPFTYLLLVVMTLFLVWEWTKVTLGSFPLPAAAMLAGGVLGFIACVDRADYPLAFAVLLLTGLCAVLLAFFGAGVSGEAARIASRRHSWWLFLGSLYIGLPCFALLWLRERPIDGLAWTIWLLVVVWSVDIAAYFVGSRVGGPRLWPRVSPSKTWSGLLGGALAASAVGGLGIVWIEAGSVWGLALGGLLLAFVAQLGDLAESAIKRHFGVKDSSRLIPGHGGLLDRVDGLLLASIALAGALWLAGV